MIIHYKKVSCESCLSKIADEMLKNPNVKKFEVDSIHQQMNLEGDDEAKLWQALKTAAQKYEPQMTLERENHDHHHDHEASFLSSRFKWIAIALGFVALIGGFIFDQPILTIAAYFLLSIEVLLKTALNFKNKHFFDENSLMTIASLGALWLGEYYEAIAVMILYQIGEWLQDRAIARSKENIKALFDVEVESAHLKKGDQLETVDPKTINYWALSNWKMN